MAAVRRCEQEADYTTARHPVIKCCAWGGSILCSRGQSHRLLALQPAGHHVERTGLVSAVERVSSGLQNEETLFCPQYPGPI